MNRQPDDPFRPLLIGVGIALAVLLLVFGMAGCATAEPKPTFPGDMRLVCYEGAYWLGSVSADEVVRLPLLCRDA